MYPYSGVYWLDEGTIDGHVVVYDNGEVVEVRDDVPGDATVELDLDGYAMPGLVDAHSHASIRPWEGNQLEQLHAIATKQATRAVSNLRRDRHAGTTTMRLMATERGLETDLAALEAIGELESPRLYPSGVHLTLTGNHGEAITATDGPDAIRERIRKNAKAERTTSNTSRRGRSRVRHGETDQFQHSDEEAQAIVDEAHRQGMHVATHAHGGPVLSKPSRKGSIQSNS